MANTEKVRLGITLDRQEYLAGESMWVSVSAYNSATETIRVLDPMQTAVVFDLLKWGNRMDPDEPSFEPSGGDGGCCFGANYTAPMVTLGPGQAVSKRFIPYYRECPSCWDVEVETPERSGRYQLEFCYSHSSASCASSEFTVVVPTFVTSATIRLNKPLRVKRAPDAPEEQYPRFVHAYLLEYNQKRYVGVQRLAQSQSDVVVVENTPLGGNVTELGLYDRIAEAALDAHSLELKADSDDNLTVSWKETNQVKSYCISAGRTTIEPCRSTHGASRFPARPRSDN